MRHIEPLKLPDVAPAAIDTEPPEARILDVWRDDRRDACDELSDIRNG